MNVKQPQRFVLNSVFAATMACYSTFSLANPTGGTVVSGNVNFNQIGNTLTITNTPGAIINWQQFSIGPDELTRFIQQNGNSAVLNRITGQDPSQILGQLQSNGRVFLINPNGIVFGQGAKIDTAGLVASTLNMSDADFKSGNMKFSGSGMGSIQNAANITTPSGGFVYLIAPSVQNNGVIVSPNGEILLAAGTSVELVDGVDTSLRVKLTAPGGEAVNVGKLIADQGRIGIFAAAIRQQGVASADRAELGAGGQVVFKASQSVTLDTGSLTSATGGGQVLVDTAGGDTVLRGKVDVSNDAGAGGQVQLLGDRVGLFDQAQVVATGTSAGGSVLVGGDFHGANPNVHNANETVMGSWAKIDASATDKGDGGKVVLWSDGVTQAYGEINATGGLHGGNGGSSEVSGLQGLNFFAKVDLGAKTAAGSTGHLLLDPTSIDISSGSGAYTSLPSVGSGPQVGFDFSTGSGTYVISPSALTNATADILLQALTDITVSEAVTTARNMELDSGGTININAPITGTGVTLNSTGGTISVGANISASSSFTASTTSGDINFAPSVAINSPSMSLTASGSIVEDTTGTFTTNNLVIGESYGTELDGTGNHISAASCSSMPCGDIRIINNGALSLGAFHAGSFVVRNSGDITLTGLSYANSISLDSGSGSILSQGGQLQSDQIALQASGGTGAVGSASSAINVTSASGNGLSVQLGYNPVTLNNVTTRSVISSQPMAAAYIHQTGTASWTSLYVDGPVAGAVQVQSDSGTLTLSAHGSSRGVSAGSIKLTGTSDVGLDLGNGALSVSGALAMASSGGTVMVGSAASISASNLSLTGPTIDFSTTQTLATISASSLSLQTDQLSNLGTNTAITASSLSLSTNSASGALTVGQSQWDRFSSLSSVAVDGTGDVSLPNVTVSGAFTGSTKGSLGVGNVNASQISLNVGSVASGDLNASNSINITVPGALGSLGSLSAPSVSLTAGGSIGSANGSEFFTGNNISLTSTGGDVYAAMSSGNAHLSAKGAVGFQGSGSVTVSASAGNGINISDSAGTLTVSNAAGGSGNVTISSAGALSLAGVSGGSVNVSAGGALSASGTLTGSDVTIQASSIGSSGSAMSVNASGSLQATASQSGGGIYLSDSSGVKSAALTTNGGSVVFSAGGDASVTVNTGRSVDQISLTSKGALTMGSNALQAGAITASAGGNLTLGGSLTASQSIVLASGGKFAANGSFSAPSLDLTTVDDIGSSGSPFLIQSSSVGLHATGSGSSVFAQGSGGTVSLSAGGGAISYTGSGTSQVTLGGSYSSLNLATTAGDLSIGGAASGSGNAVIASAGSLSLSGLSSNGVQLTSTGALTATGAIDAGSGSATINSGGNLGVAGVSGSGVQLTAAGNMTLGGAVNAGSGVLTVSASGITGSGSLAGDQINVTSGGAVGSAGQALAVNAGSSLNVKTTGSGAGIYLSEADGVGAANLSTADGDIAFTSGGAATISAIAGGSGHGAMLTTTSGDLTVQSLQTGGGALTLASAGQLMLPTGISLSATDLTLKSASSFSLAATLTASSSLTVESSGGSVNTSGSGLFSAPTLTLRGAQGVGAAGAAVNVQTGNLTAESTGGGVYIASNGGLSTASLKTAGGDISLQSAGTGALVGTIDAGAGKVTVNAGGDLNGQIAGANLDLTTGGALGSSSQRAQLNTGNLLVHSQGAVYAGATGDLAANVTTAKGGIDIQDGGKLTLMGSAGGSGNVVLASAGDLIFAGFQTAGDVTATAGGSIGGSGAGDQLTGRLASFSASANIGSMSTKLQQLSATAGGGVSLVNSAPLEIASLSSGGDVSIESNGGLTTTGAVVSPGTVNLITHSPLTIGSGGIQAGSGISLKSGTGTGHDDITINGSLTSASGDCSVQAGGGVQQNANIVLQGNGAVSVNAATGGVAMAAGTSTSTNGGSVGYAAQGNITLASIDAGATGSVSLTSSQGNVTSATAGGINVHAGNLAVQASGIIDLGADVPADGLSIKSSSGYQVIHGADGSLLPGSHVPSGGDDGSGSGSNGGSSSQSQVVNTVNSTTNTISQGSAASTVDNTQQKIDKQQQNSNDSSGGSSQNGKGNEGSDDNQSHKKPKKC